jgi:hypothetical protein
MKKQNKYEYLYYIQGRYGSLYGWEDVDCHENRKEARAALKCYRENEPQYTHRMIFRREVNNA